MKTMICDRNQLRACNPIRGVLLLPVLCMIGVLCALPFAGARGAAGSQAPASAGTGATAVKKHAARNQKEEQYFELRYGIGQLRVHAMSAGASLEFRCLVLDAGKAAALNNNRAAPVMIDRKTGKRLSLPAADNKPHQTAPEAGQEYSVAFGNRDKLVKPGNLVDVVVGTVHMSGLIVE
jgi:hypothetical protein